MLYLYILHCSDNSLYTGVTNNIDNRLAQHEEGINPDAYTYSRRPVELVFVEGFADYKMAIAWEKRIKRWSAKKKWALIKDDWTSLKSFAECRNDSHFKNEK